MFIALAFLTHAATTDPVVLSGNILGNQIAVTTSDLIYWGIAAVVGLVAETLVGWRLPFGVIGAIFASLIGVWLLTDVISLQVVGNVTIAGQNIPIVKALLGAIIVVAIWHLLTYPVWHRRHSYYRGYRDGYRRDY